MLAESLVYASSWGRTPPAFRPHLGEAIGLWARGRRQSRAWALHLANTRAVIEGAMEPLPSRRTVAVLGAGPLFDIPLERLAENFERVLLIDLAHLSPAKRRLAPYSNIERLWRDLAPRGEPRPLAVLDDIPGLDWVISANLVSQLAHAAPEGTERQMVDAHLDGLAALRAPVTLVTDTTYRIFDRSGALIEEADLLHGRTLPEPDSQWLWDVAPFGEESRDARRVHAVVAFPDWR